MFKTNRSCISLRPGHKDFAFSPDGITVVSRASLEITQDCPYEYRLILAKCLEQGWLRAVANMRDTEYTMELLRK
jgi:hypothetical protein